VPELNKLAEKFKDIAHFLTVYISEAHASDVWPLGTTVCIQRHKTIEDRIKAAKDQLIEKRDCKIPVLIDTMDNDFDKNYHGWPERFFVIKGKFIELVGMPSRINKGFERKQISSWLESHQNLLNEEKKEI